MYQFPFAQPTMDSYYIQQPPVFMQPQPFQVYIHFTDRIPGWLLYPATSCIHATTTISGIYPLYRQNTGLATISSNPLYIKQIFSITLGYRLDTLSTIQQLSVFMQPLTYQVDIHYNARIQARYFIHYPATICIHATTNISSRYSL